MTYEKQTWEGEPSTNTPLSAGRFNHMEDGIDDAHSELDGRLSGEQLSKDFAPLQNPNIILFGDSRTADSDFSDGVNEFITNMSWFDWGQANLPHGPVFDVIRNAAIGGNTTSQMLARFQSDVLDHKPSHITLWGSINDGWADVNTDVPLVAATFSRMATMMDMARAAGTYVFLISETAVGTSKGYGYPMLVAHYNDLLRNYAATHAGVEYWDFNAVITNPENPAGYADASLLRDGVHLNPYSASLLGQSVVAPALSRFSTPLAQLPSSQVDTLSVNPASFNAVSNPLMTGSSGPLGTGHTGTLPTAWASSGAPAAECSVVDRADGVGSDAKAEITADSAGGFFLTQNLNMTRIALGETYVLEMSLGIDEATNVSSVAPYAIFFGPASASWRYGWSPTQVVAEGDKLVTADELVFRSRNFVAPIGATSAQISLRVGFAGGGSATVRLGRVALKRLP